MDHPVTAVYDANVLDPAPLRDLVIRSAQAGLVRARWTDAIRQAIRSGAPIVERESRNLMPRDA